MADEEAGEPESQNRNPSWETGTINGEMQLVIGETRELGATNLRTGLANRKLRRSGKGQGETRKPGLPSHPNSWETVTNARNEAGGQTKPRTTTSKPAE